MAPKKSNHEFSPKKIKIQKDPKIKIKKKKISSNSNTAAATASVSGSENRGVDSEWWISFWDKNASAPGVPEDEEEEGFKYFFRVSKKTFEYICSTVREDLISRPPSGLINIEGRLLSVEKQVAIALRRLASGESQVLVGSSFGVGQSTVSQVTWRFIEAMEERGRHHLKWPDNDNLQKIKTNFESLFKLPNCCGAIDATHIVMTLPAVQTSDDWCDQVKNYSMLVQAGERLNGNPKTFSGESEIREYIVGGVNYPLLPWLITPYHEGDEVAGFNKVHEGARSVVVKAFSQVKGRWRILNKVMWRPDKKKLPSIIVVCCLLHNIIIDCGDDIKSDDSLLSHHDSGYVEQRCNHVDPIGRKMRENLVSYLEHTK
ncbi:protein ANTAGONIST OF LIKE HETEROCHROMATIN PROTEIN 1-like isoform X2 [Rutidosis leptorrhynchoides]|uniref:protein ANTAGONIST OF LIKE HETEROCHROMATIN PROTEIN 1-like isoform X2 n=1 Tax=Rutidosis leptorrhynchoides TaxID=125765 RepID=UPI003A9A2779